MAGKKSRGPPKLPVQQLSILAICRFAEPIALTSVFPYLPEMIESFGVDKANVARWAGITSAVFSLSQFCTAILWGRASDIFGRKPVILLGLTITMTCSFLWGFSKSLPWAIACRALSGGGNGNVGIIRTMVAELVPEKELQPRAFSVMPLVWSLGSILGPAFGGLLAKPATNLPGLFGQNKFLIQFPFVLPNLVIVVFFMFGIIVGALFLKETLETRKNRPDYGIFLGKKLIECVKRKPKRHTDYDDDDEDAALLEPTSATSSTKNFDTEWQPSTKPVLPPPRIRDVFTRQSTLNLICYSFLACTSMAWDQTVPIFMHHPVQIPDESNTHLPFKFAGGFGIGSGRIGTIFTMYGILGAVIQFMVYPPVARRFGVLKCFKVCSAVLPFVYFSTPYTALIQNSALQQLAFFGIMSVKSVCVIFAFPSSTILLTNSATSLRILGTLNGVATSVSAIGRALGPFVSGNAFTWGVETGYGVTPWFLLGIISIFGAVPIWWLVEMEGFNSTDDSEEEEDDDEEELLADQEGSSSIIAGDEAVAIDEEAIDVVEGPPLQPIRLRRSSTPRLERRSSTPRLERRMSNPIGVRGDSVGPGGGRRFSNGIGFSNFGQGTGGTPFN